jgi:hypothetical protein
MRLSTGARDFINKFGSVSRMLTNGRIELYTGAQPSSPDAAFTGTLLCVLTNNAGTYTAESPAVGSVTLAGSAGSVNTITVGGIDVLGGAVPFNGTLAQTALDTAAQINRNMSYPKYRASASGAVISIFSLPGSAVANNTLTVSGTFTTLTGTYSNMSGGVASANGLLYDNSVAGVLSKLSTQTWSGTNSAAGTVGWFRMYGSQSDTGALDSNAQFPRIDGAVATSGGELNFNSTAFSSGAVTTVPAFTVTLPAQ